MTTLKVKIENLEDTLSDVAAAWKHAEASRSGTASSTLAFGSWETMHRVLAPKRLEIVRAMTGQGALSIREVARRVRRDFKSVHNDLDLLCRNGVVDKSNHGVIFPYDRIHVEFEIEVAA